MTAPDMTPDRIRALRKRLGLSAAAFARAIGVADGRTIRHWEAADWIPNGAACRLMEAAESIEAVRELLLEKSRAEYWQKTPLS